MNESVMMGLTLPSPPWFSVVGLGLDTLAVIAFAWDVARGSTVPATVPAANVGGGASRVSWFERLGASRLAIACAFVLATGFALQIYGEWPR